MRMIPTTVSKDCVSKAERRLFEWFRTSKNTEGWICMHSVRLQGHHRYKRMAELDFLLLTPLGVLVLEVKGGRIHKKGHRKWLYQDGTGRLTPKHEGPFEQAAGGMHTLERWLGKQTHLNTLRSTILFGWGVAMPDMPPMDWGSDADSDQVYDISNRGNTVHETVNQMMAVARRASHAQKRRPPTTSEIETITNTLAGKVTTVGHLELERQIASGLIESTQEHMFESLDTWGHHKRLMIHTPSGTGSVAFTAEIISRLAHSNNTIGLLTPHGHPWLELLLDLDQDDCRVIPPTQFEKLDALIVLDAHHVKYEHLELAFSTLARGIQHDQWVIMHDARNHVSKPDEQVLAFIDYLDSYAETQTLVHNICHAQGITRVINNICKPTLRLTSNIPGPAPQMSVYSNQQELAKNIEHTIKHMVDDGGIPEHHVMVLVCEEDQRSSVEQTLSNLQRDLPVMTINEAQGLMADAVILIGVEQLHQNRWKDLVYQGAGKARIILSMIVQPDAMADYLKILTTELTPR